MNSFLDVRNPFKAVRNAFKDTKTAAMRAMDERFEATDAFLRAADRVIDAKDQVMTATGAFMRAPIAFYDRRSSLFAAENRSQKLGHGLSSGSGALEGTARGCFGTMDRLDPGAIGGDESSEAVDGAETLSNGAIGSPMSDTGKGQGLASFMTVLAVVQ